MIHLKPAMNPRLKISDGAPARPGPLSAEPARHIHQCLRWPGPGGPGTGVYNEMRHGGAHVPPGQPLSEGGWSLAGLSANPYVERGPEVAQALASMGKLQKLKNVRFLHCPLEQGAWTSGLDPAFSFARCRAAGQSHVLLPTRLSLHSHVAPDLFLRWGPLFPGHRVT